jgi:prepilin-type N-terminal cleavage/methylation domain-containing protein
MAETHRFSNGFTLVELVITVSLLGVLLAIAVPAFQQLTLNRA